MDTNRSASRDRRALNLLPAVMYRLAENNAHDLSEAEIRRCVADTVAPDVCAWVALYASRHRILTWNRLKGARAEYAKALAKERAAP